MSTAALFTSKPSSELRLTILTHIVKEDRACMAPQKSSVPTGNHDEKGGLILLLRFRFRKYVGIFATTVWSIEPSPRADTWSTPSPLVDVSEGPSRDPIRYSPSTALSFPGTGNHGERAFHYYATRPLAVTSWEAVGMASDYPPVCS